MAYQITDSEQPVSCPVRRRSKKELDQEREATKKLLVMGVM